MSNGMISSAPKPTLDYRVVVGYNPKDEENNLLRPIIVNKETYDTSRCLRFAMDNGYIVGTTGSSMYCVKGESEKTLLGSEL